MLIKNLIDFSVAINVKQFRNIFEEKYYAPLRILYPFIKYFVNHCSGVDSTYFDSSFNSFPASTCFNLFELFILLKLNSLLSKVLFTNLTISFFLAKSICFNLAEKLAAVNLLNY